MQPQRLMDRAHACGRKLPLGVAACLVALGLGGCAHSPPRASARAATVQRDANSPLPAETAGESKDSDRHESAQPDPPPVERAREPPPNPPGRSPPSSSI